MKPSVASAHAALSGSRAGTWAGAGEGLSPSLRSLSSRTVIGERKNGCKARARARHRGQCSGSMCGKRLVCSDKPHREQFRYTSRPHRVIRLHCPAVFRPVIRPSGPAVNRGRRAGSSSVQRAAGGGPAQLAERSLLNLAHALAAEPDLLPDVAKRLLGAFEAIACAKDHPLAVVEAAQ